MLHKQEEAVVDRSQLGESIGDQLLMPDSTFFLVVTACLLRLAAGLGMPPEEAEEIVQEAWLDAAEHRDLFGGAEGVRRFHGRMREVVRNKARDRQRHLYCCRFVSLPEGGGDLIDRAEEERREEVEEWELLETVLAKGRMDSELSHRLLCGHYLEGRSMENLAQEYNLKECAVEGRIRRYRMKLRALAEGGSGGGAAPGRENGGKR